jgi:putative transposase
VKYAWIKQHMTEFPTDSMCRFMQVSRSAYYAWLHRAQTAIETDDIELTAIIQGLFKKSRATYGWNPATPKIVIKPRSGS